MLVISSLTEYRIDNTSDIARHTTSTTSDQLKIGKSKHQRQMLNSINKEQYMFSQDRSAPHDQSEPCKSRNKVQGILSKGTEPSAFTNSQ